MEGKLQGCIVPFLPVWAAHPTPALSFECYNPMTLKFVGLMPFTLFKIFEHLKKLISK